MERSDNQIYGITGVQQRERHLTAISLHHVVATIAKLFRKHLPDQRLILVDDVFTTGSTLNTCAGVLRRAGSLNLDVVTFGHG